MKIITQDRNKLRGVAMPIVTEGTGITMDTSYNAVVVSRFTVPSTTQSVAAASLGFGILLATLPKGNLIVHHVSLDMIYALDGAGAATMDMGVGTVIATGAVSVLGGTGTFEDCMNGTSATITNGTANVTYTFGALGETDQKDGASTAKSLYLNMASAWAGITQVLTYRGTVTVTWSLAETS